MDVQEKISKGEYINKLSFTQRPHKPSVGDITAMSDAELKRLSQVRDEYNSALAKWDADRKAYSAESARIHAQFIADVEDEFDMKGHPKAGMLFDKAWSHGHASGYSDVYYYYCDLVDLVK